MPVTATMERGLTGIETEAFGSDPSEIDKTYQFRYRVVELADLIASHDNNLMPDERYPSELQPRIRDRAASRIQVDNIARNLNPRALLMDTGFIDTGAMIIGGDMVVESGNGRVLALRKARKDYPDRFAQYKKMLAGMADKVGIKADDLKGMEAPVLVRERTSEVNRVKFAREANVGAVMGMSPYEQAIQDGRGLSANIVGNLAVGEEQTIDQALRMRANDDIVKHFVSNIPANERATISDEKGNLNQRGMERLKLALFSRTYTGDAGKRLTRIFGESVDPYVKQVENAMFASLPDMAKAEGLIDAKQRDADLSIAPDMAEVIDTYASLKATGMTVKDYLKQSAMFEERLDGLQKAILEHLDDISKRPKLIRELLRDTAQAITEAPPPEQKSFMGIEPVSKRGILRHVITKQRDEAKLPALKIGTRPASAEGKGLEGADGEGAESAARMESKVAGDSGRGKGARELAPSTSVQVGLVGLGKESAQVKMLEEFGTAVGQGGKKDTLIDVDKEKARLAAKPLKGQIAMAEPKAKTPKRKRKQAKPPSARTVKRLQKERTKQATAADKARAHSLTLEVGDPRTKRWARDPARADIIGIDTPQTMKSGGRKLTVTRGSEVLKNKESKGRRPRTSKSGERELGGGVVQSGKRRHLKLT